jgi:DNA-directed RNA polymerase subunit M/transcription elongation factor TFIIS
MSEIKEFTKNSPACPKCGHKTNRRYYDHSRSGDYGSVLYLLDPGEYFIVTCQDCHYQFAQNVKKEAADEKEER